MIRKILKRAVIGIGLLGVLGFGALHAYKTRYLTMPVPAELVVDFSEVITLDGTIFDLRYLSRFGGDQQKIPGFFGERKFVDMPEKTRQLVQLVKAGKKRIVILINSGGGLMEPGMEFVQAMRGARTLGVDLVCVVDNHAMSMALIIFSECSTRYAVFASKLMWHSIAQQGRMRINQQTATELLDYMIAKNEEVWASTRIHFMPWYFVKHFKNETILDASELEQTGIGYLRVIKTIKINNLPKLESNLPAAKLKKGKVSDKAKSKNQR